MAKGLTRMLLEPSLTPSAARARVLEPGAELALRCEQLLTDAEAAILVFQSFESSGLARAQGDLALVCAESPAVAPGFEVGDELNYVQSVSRRFGVHFSRPGNGRAHHVHAARIAAPGRTLLACAGGAAAVGALGTFVESASEVELAAALAGVPRAAALPPVWAVRLDGTLPSWVGAQDLVLAMARRLEAGEAEGVVLEYCGPGVAALSQEARFTVAREGVASLGARASVFPSDDVTRHWLRAQGREPDWKALTGEPESDASRVLEFHLDALDPMVVRAEEGAVPIDVRATAAFPVRRVVVGADSELSDLMLVAEIVRGRTLPSGVELVVVPGSRQIRETAAACGAIEALRAAGATVLDCEARLAPAPPTGAVLLCGASLAAARRSRSSFLSGPAVGAASALAGRIADPRDLPLSAPVVVVPERFEVNDALLARPTSGPAGVDVVRGPALGSPAMLPPILTTLRGVVLLRLGDRVSTEVALPRGPRVWRNRSDLETLADYLFADVDPGFARRARAHRGGFLVAGVEYGCGPRQPRAALALVQLGVRAVLARSFDARHRTDLVQHGVLPLRFAVGAVPDALSDGDELEIPGLPEGLERNKPLVLRDLTRGTQLAFHHDLTPREIEMVRAGGLMGATVLAGAGA